MSSGPTHNRPRLVLAGLSGGAGKTLVSLGIARAWAERGLAVAPYKKGPDYIDAAWLGLAAGREARNLDPFLLSRDILTALFFQTSGQADISVIEGNRGLYDGKDLEGSCSTAELARLLAAPVALILDATKMTRTAAAVVAGIKNFEPINLAGVVLNRVAGERHRRVLRQTIEHYTGVPVLGMLPKMADNPIPERHMGLVSCREHGAVEAILGAVAALARENLDLDRLIDVARSAPPMAEPAATLWSDVPDFSFPDAAPTTPRNRPDHGAAAPTPLRVVTSRPRPARQPFPLPGTAGPHDPPRDDRSEWPVGHDGLGGTDGSGRTADPDRSVRPVPIDDPNRPDGHGRTADPDRPVPIDDPDRPGGQGRGPAPRGGRPLIGVVRDAALWFYYPENIEALRHAGADIAIVSLLGDAPWPELDGLYLGGGFPETQAEALADAAATRARVRALSGLGLPIYAECGGFMYLCRELRLGEVAYPMAGVFDLATTLCPRPQGLGYSRAEVTRANPFFRVGAVLTGHEFHYSRCVGGVSGETGTGGNFCLTMRRGVGMLDGRDGLLSEATFAAYTHIHALGAPEWAGNFTAAARAFAALARR